MRPTLRQRLVACLQLFLEPLQLPRLLGAHVPSGFQTLGLHIQLAAHLFAGALCLGQDRAQALDLRIALLQQLVLRPALAGRLAVFAQQALVVAVQAGQFSAGLLRQLGFSVDWHAYPMAHQVCAEQIRDLGEWLTRRFTDA